MRLIIIGNGFDLHHKLKTEYKDYCRFLNSHNPDAMESIRSSPYFDGTCVNIFDENDFFWTDVEGNLKFNFDAMLEESVGGYYPDLMEKSDARWHRIEFDSEAKVRMIDTAFTTYAFVNWLNTIDVSKAEETRRMKFRPDDLFISFNYTETLEKFYGIPAEKILHIHGCISSPETLQFGNPEQTPTIVNEKLADIYGDDEFYGMSIEPAVNIYTNLAKVFSKDINSNLPILTNIITDKDISEIVIMGHSYLGVDKAYYEDVLIPKFQKVHWIIYCHKEHDYAAAQKYIAEKKLDGIPVYWDK